MKSHSRFVPPPGIVSKVPSDRYRISAPSACGCHFSLLRISQAHKPRQAPFCLFNAIPLPLDCRGWTSFLPALHSLKRLISHIFGILPLPIAITTSFLALLASAAVITGKWKMTTASYSSFYEHFWLYVYHNGRNLPNTAPSLFQLISALVLVFPLHLVSCIIYACLPAVVCYWAHMCGVRKYIFINLYRQDYIRL